MVRRWVGEVPNSMDPRLSMSRSLCDLGLCFLRRCVSFSVSFIVTKNIPSGGRRPRRCRMAASVEDPVIDARSPSGSGSPLRRKSQHN